jgi:hypothetical protein
VLVGRFCANDGNPTIRWEEARSYDKPETLPRIPFGDDSAEYSLLVECCQKEGVEVPKMYVAPVVTPEDIQEMEAKRVRQEELDAKAKFASHDKWDGPDGRSLYRG